MAWGLISTRENCTFYIKQYKYPYIIGARVKGYKSRNYNRSMIAALQLIFYITSNLAKILLQS
jgi:hypothetical protein